jgi:RND family efflux transporter MFP subunit
MSSQPFKTPNLRRLLLVGVVALVAAVTIATYGIASRASNKQDLVQWTNAQAVPTVTLAKLEQGDANRTLALPGGIQPYYKASLYARVNGYVKNWNRDIGAHVKAGDVLATLDAPDLDQQLAQARATLASAKANYDIAAITADRYAALVKKQAIALQLADQANADAAAKKAVMDANEANAKQLEAMQAFKQIVAPFDGVVTARNTDIGALINSGNAGQALFEISDLHRIRIYVQVPQAFTAQLKPGLKATFAMPQYPGQKFDAILQTTSNAVNESSRTMQVGLQADNPDGKFVGGTYSQVEFQIPGNPNLVRIPATALMPVNSGVQVAVLNDGNQVTLKPIQLGRDFGNSVEVMAGLNPQDRVIDSPSETLQSGDVVQLPTAASTTSTQAMVPVPTNQN